MIYDFEPLSRFVLAGPRSFLASSGEGGSMKEHFEKQSKM